MLVVNNYSCCSLIQVLVVLRYFCSFCEVLGVITKIDEALGKCYLLSVIWFTGSRGSYVLTIRKLKVRKGVMFYSFF